MLLPVRLPALSHANSTKTKIENLELYLWGPHAQVRRVPPQHLPAHDRANFASWPRPRADLRLARLWRLRLSVLEIECRRQTAPSSRPTCTSPTVSQSSSLPWPISPPRTSSSSQRRACQHHERRPRQLHLQHVPLCGSRQQLPWCATGSWGATVMNHTQHVLTTIANEAETRRVISLVSGLDNPDLPCLMELYHSNFFFLNF